MIFATGITPNFEPRAHELFRTALVHNIPLVVFLVNYEGRIPDCCVGLKTIQVNYNEVELQAPKFMLQHGAFTQWADELPCDDSEVVVFVDADAYFQRPMTKEEIELIDGTLLGEFKIGRNNPDPTQTLENEAMFLGPSCTPSDIARRFPPGSESPYINEMLCRNFGFVAAGLEDWKALYFDMKKHWSDALRTFSNPALVQWVSLYCVQRYQWIGDELPLSIHAHGHLGLAPGVGKRLDTWYHAEKDKDGFAVRERVIFYAHAL